MIKKKGLIFRPVNLQCVGRLLTPFITEHTHRVEQTTNVLVRSCAVSFRGLNELNPQLQRYFRVGREIKGDVRQDLSDTGSDNTWRVDHLVRGSLFSSIPERHPPDSRNIPLSPSGVIMKMSPGIARYPLGSRITPGLKPPVSGHPPYPTGEKIKAQKDQIT